jgi:hypothetical protein
MAAAFSQFRQQRYLYAMMAVFGFYIATLLANGLATTDIPDFISMSRDTSKVLLSGERQMFYASPLNALLGDWLHLGTISGFFIIHIGETVLMLACAGFAIGRKLESAEQRLLYVVLLSLTPLWLISMKWIGKTDPVMISGFFLCWALQSRWRILIVFIMIVAHREIGSLMTLSLFFLEGRKDRNLLYALALGNAFHLFYQYGVLDQLPSSRAGLMKDKAVKFITAYAPLQALYVMSMFSWYWILICLEKPQRVEATVLALAFGLALINEDFTRDFTLAALPAVVFHIERVVKSGFYTRMVRLWPLTVMHFQIAALGQFYAAHNSFVLLLMR